MKKKMFIATIVFFVSNAAFAIISAISKSALATTLAITTGTFLYHCVMRLIVGYTVPYNRFDYRQKWFAEKSFEKNLYKKIGVKKWKKNMPSFDPSGFDMEKHSYTEIANTMCRNEVIHEIIMVLSFVPILFSLYAHSILVFIITSIIACAFDSAFVIMQRYNRPRIVRLIERENRKKRSSNK